MIAGLVVGYASTASEDWHVAYWTPAGAVVDLGGTSQSSASAVNDTGQLVGSIVLTGTSPIKTSLTIAIRRHGAKKNSTSSTLAATGGKWSKTIKLPGSLTPGKYDVTVSGPGVSSSQTSFSIAAPTSGIVKHAYATGPKRGPAATALVGTSELWAHFQFSFLPNKKQSITTQWILPDGKKLAANTRPRATIVEAQVKDLSGKNLPTGRWRCVIRAGGTVIATLNVRLK